MRIGSLNTRGVAREAQGPLELLPGHVRGPEDWDALFGRPGPLKLEVGPGKGNWIREMADREPETNWVAMEIKRSRCVWIEEKLLRAGVENVRMMRGDALRELPVSFAPGGLAAIHVNFFDPWPRDRHARRRFAQPRLANACAQLLQVGGDLYFVTDHPERALEAREVFGAHPILEDVWGEERLTERIPDYVQTIHEKKFRAKGRTIHFLWYRRRP
jgi:tRNA (guanine-N7-)-methyltransferase